MSVSMLSDLIKHHSLTNHRHASESPDINYWEGGTDCTIIVPNISNFKEKKLFVWNILSIKLECHVYYK